MWQERYKSSTAINILADKAAQYPTMIGGAGRLERIGALAIINFSYNNNKHQCYEVKYNATIKASVDMVATLLQTSLALLDCFLFLLIGWRKNATLITKGNKHQLSTI